MGRSLHMAAVCCNLPHSTWEEIQEALIVLIKKYIGRWAITQLQHLATVKLDSLFITEQGILFKAIEYTPLLGDSSIAPQEFLAEIKKCSRGIGPHRWTLDMVWPEELLTGNIFEGHNPVPPRQRLWHSRKKGQIITVGERQGPLDAYFKRKNL